jgi:hypothetical protein
VCGSVVDLARARTDSYDLTQWLRRRLRQVRWTQWKLPRTLRRNLRALGINELNARQWASSRKGYWRIAGSPVLASSLPNAYWANLGLQRFAEPYRRFPDAKRTARCGPRTPGGPGGVGVCSAPTRFHQIATNSLIGLDRQELTTPWRDHTTCRARTKRARGLRALVWWRQARGLSTSKGTDSALISPNDVTSVGVARFSAQSARIRIRFPDMTDR